MSTLPPHPLVSMITGSDSSCPFLIAGSSSWHSICVPLKEVRKNLLLSRSERKSSKQWFVSYSLGMPSPSSSPGGVVTVMVQVLLVLAPSLSDT